MLSIDGVGTYCHVLRSIMNSQLLEVHSLTEPAATLDRSASLPNHPTMSGTGSRRVVIACCNTKEVRKRSVLWGYFSSLNRCSISLAELKQAYGNWVSKRVCIMSTQRANVTLYDLLATDWNPVECRKDSHAEPSRRVSATHGGASIRQFGDLAVA